MLKLLLFLSLLGVCFSSGYFTQTHSGIVSFDEDNFGKFYGQTFHVTNNGNFSQVMIETEILNPKTLLPSSTENPTCGILCKRMLNIFVLRDNHFMGKNFEKLSSKNIRTWKNSDIYHYTLFEGKLQIILNLPQKVEKVTEYFTNPYFIYFMVDKDIINSDNFEDCDQLPTVFNYTRYQR